jgi:hypothetical protein
MANIHDRWTEQVSNYIENAQERVKLQSRQMLKHVFQGSRTIKLYNAKRNSAPLHWLLELNIFFGCWSHSHVEHGMAHNNGTPP